MGPGIPEGRVLVQQMTIRHLRINPGSMFYPTVEREFPCPYSLRTATIAVYNIQ